MLELFSLPFSNTAPALCFLDSNQQKASSSFAEYFEQSLVIADTLTQQGFSHGDRLAFISQNTPKTALLLLACLQAGFVAMPISPRFPENVVKELTRVANAQLVNNIAPFLVLNQAHILRQTTLPTQASEGNLLENLLEQDATILCTSGSTGLPKMILHTAANHYWSAVGAAENIPFGAGDCWLASLPLYHVGGYGIFFRALVGGAAIAFPSSANFDVRLLTETLHHFPITHCSFVSAQLYQALRYPELVQKLQRLKAIVLGGSAIPQSLIMQSLAKGLRIFTSYGSTEMASQISTSISSEPSELQTSGTVLPHREVHISDDGEILVRGKTLAKGRITEQGIVTLADANAWYHTGDLGKLEAPSLDAKGRLTVFGRRDTMFISGGENIYPEAIERILCENVDIMQAIVVPVQHEIYGCRPVAFVQRQSNEALTEPWRHKIRTDLAMKLPRFALPDKFFLFPPEMLTSVIKPRRSELLKIANEYLLRAHDEA